MEKGMEKGVQKVAEKLLTLGMPPVFRIGTPKIIFGLASG